VGSAESKFLYWTGLTGLIGSIVFSVSGRNREMAIPLSAGKESQRSGWYCCRTITPFLHFVFIAKRTSSKRDLSFCLSSHWGVGPYGPEAGKAKNPGNPVDPV